MSAAVSETQEAIGLASSHVSMETVTDLSRRSAPPSGPVARRSALPPAAPVTLPQAEEGSATATAGEGTEEQRRKAEAKERVEGGKATVAFSFSVLSGCLCFFPNDATHKSNVAFSVCFFLAFATFVSGNALMVLSMSMLDLRADLVSGGHYAAAANCLAVSCAVLSVLTLFSLVALLRNRQYRYISLAAVTVVLLPAAGVHWYLRRRTGGGRDVQAYNNEEHKEELEAASKVTSCITNFAFGGLVGVLFSSWGAAAAAEDADSAAYVAIFFLFATAVMGMFVTTVTNKVSSITRPGFQRHFITAIRLANASLLCSLACAGLAAGFAVLGYRVFAAFAPLVTACIICFLLRHGAPGGEANGEQPENQEQLEAIEDVASKVAFGGIMSVLGASTGATKYNSQQAGVRDTFVVVLTSAFLSGLGIMLLAAVPRRSARELLAPVAKVLVWSSVALFAATAASVYAVELWTM